MMVLDVKTKAWSRNQSLTYHVGYSTSSDRNEGETVQLIPNTTYALFFGEEDPFCPSEFSARLSTQILDFSTYSWTHFYEIDNFKDGDMRRLQKGYASSVIILDKYLVLAFGTLGSIYPGELSDVDIFELPSQEFPSLEGFLT